MQLSRFNTEGVNKSTECETERGRKYLQCLLNEMDMGNYSDWIQTSSESDESLASGVIKVYSKLVDKLKAKEPLSMPGGSTRDIPANMSIILIAAMKVWV